MKLITEVSKEGRITTYIQVDEGDTDDVARSVQILEGVISAIVTKKVILNKQQRQAVNKILAEISKSRIEQGDEANSPPTPDVV